MGLRRWLELDFWLLALLVGAVYFTRLGDAPLSGEEPRRGQIAREMIRWNDWLVPRQQGLPFLSRPPVQNWIIAAVGMTRGSIDEVAIRLPSAVATLLTALMIYGYCRGFLSRLGALAAGAAFATMGLVLQFGWLGETEAIYTLLIGGSLLLWHWADAAKKPALWGWCAGYGLAALGMLTKGPQAPVYFVGGVGLFLLLSRRWRELLRWQHFVGLALFLAVWGAWQIPFSLHVTVQDSLGMFAGDVALRFDDAGWLDFGEHLVSFPADVLVCMLPWSVLLLAYTSRDFRRSVGFARERLLFLTCSIGVAFLTCWLAPGARNRYFAPVFPCVAPLIGLVVEQCREAAPWANLWRRYLKGMGVAVFAVSLWVAAATALNWGPFLGAQPPAFAVVYLATAAAIGIVLFRLAARFRPLDQRIAILGVAAFLGLSFMGLMVNVFVALRRPIPESIAELKRQLPENAELVSIGPANPIFSYYYEQPIRQILCPSPQPPGAPPWTYFCIGDDVAGEVCDFPYEKLTEVSTNPFLSREPSRAVIVGRRRGPAGDPSETAGRRTVGR
jgi:4-amino-4-deoxy-L-arabinose transferase-like glycosyltransferase